MSAADPWLSHPWRKIVYRHMKDGLVDVEGAVKELMKTRVYWDGERFVEVKGPNRVEVDVWEEKNGSWERRKVEYSMEDYFRAMLEAYNEARRIFGEKLRGVVFSGQTAHSAMVTLPNIHEREREDSWGRAERVITFDAPDIDIRLELGEMDEGEREEKLNKYISALRRIEKKYNLGLTFDVFSPYQLLERPDSVPIFGIGDFSPRLDPGFLKFLRERTRRERNFLRELVEKGKGVVEGRFPVRPPFDVDEEELNSFAQATRGKGWRELSREEKISVFKHFILNRLRIRTLKTLKKLP